MLWKVVEDCVVEGEKDNYEIGLWRFAFNLFYKEEGGGKDKD